MTEICIRIGEDVRVEVGEEVRWEESEEGEQVYLGGSDCPNEV